MTKLIHIVWIAIVTLVMFAPDGNATTHHRPRSYSYSNSDVYRGQMTKVKNSLGIHYHTYTPKHSKKY